MILDLRLLSQWSIPYLHTVRPQHFSAIPYALDRINHKIKRRDARELAAKVKFLVRTTCRQILIGDSPQTEPSLRNPLYNAAGKSGTEGYISELFRSNLKCGARYDRLTPLRLDLICV
jgi:hypothetical protein